MFDPWRLRTLQALARRGTMAAVADELALSPSAVSQQLAALERDAGVPLTEPDGRRVRLTPAGRTLAAHADAILGAMQAASDEMEAYEKDAVGQLRIASFPSAAAHLCPAVLADLERRFPRHRISFQELQPHESLAALAHGDLDLALVDAIGAPVLGEASRVTFEALYVDELAAVTPRGHPAEHHRGVVVSDLAAERWVMTEPGTRYHALVVEICQNAGFQPDVVANCRSIRVVTAMVAAGVGVAILPSFSVAGRRDVAVRPLRPPVTRLIYAVWRLGTERRPAIRATLDAFRAEVRRLAEREVIRQVAEASALEPPDTVGAPI